MKKHILAIALAALAIGFTSCTEKEPLPDQPTDTTENPGTPDVNYAEAILGQWNAVLDRCYESYIENDDYDETTYASDWASALSLTFKTDGYLTYSATVSGVKDSWDDAYSITADTLIWDTRKFKILTISDSQLIFENNVEGTRTTSGGTTYTTKVIKHWEFQR